MKMAVLDLECGSGRVVRGVFSVALGSFKKHSLLLFLRIRRATRLYVVGGRGGEPCALTLSPPAARAR